MVLHDGGNPRPVRRQFFAQPVVPQESDSTVGGGYDGYDPFVTPTKVKVNVFSIVFNLTPPVFKRNKQPWQKNMFRYTHGKFLGGCGDGFSVVCWRTFYFFFKKKFLMELPGAERKSQDEIFVARVSIEKKVILEFFAKTRIFFFQNRIFVGRV